MSTFSNLRTMLAAFIIVMVVVSIFLFNQGRGAETGHASGTTTVTTATTSTSTTMTGTTVPPIANSTETFSRNWAGYAVSTSFSSPETGSMNEAEGAWTVPAADCANTTGEYSSSFWVGIDGYSSQSVEQIGTDSDCFRGSPSYYAWYEMYPDNGFSLSMRIMPGDVINAKVEHIGNNVFRLTITDVTTGSTFSTIETGASALRNSAEWIAEAPTLNNRILPLSQFGPVMFTDCYVTVKGVKGAIGDSRWENRALILDSRAGVIKAVPSGLVGNGTGFTVTWEHS